MPILTICPTKGCRRLTTGGHCPSHRHGNPRRHQKLSARTANTAYWRTLRLIVLDRDQHTCQLCGGARCRNRDLTVHLNPALHGNHLAASLADCITLSRSCHGSVDAPRARIVIGAATAGQPDTTARSNRGGGQHARRTP